MECLGANPQKLKQLFSIGAFPFSITRRRNRKPSGDTSFVCFLIILLASRETFASQSDEWKRKKKLKTFIKFNACKNESQSYLVVVILHHIWAKNKLRLSPIFPSALLLIYCFTLLLSRRNFAKSTFPSSHFIESSHRFQLQNEKSTRGTRQCTCSSISCRFACIVSKSASVGLRNIRKVMQYTSRWFPLFSLRH